MRTVVVDNGCGPLVIADLNGDDRPDLAIVNNRKSRIELHFLRGSERTDVQIERAAKVNDLPPNPWYDRSDVSVTHRVQALLAHDVNGDGLQDLVYAGASPTELVALAQGPDGFEEVFTRRVRDLSASQVGFAIADVVGNSSPELVTLADANIIVVPLESSGAFGEPTVVSPSGDAVAVFVEDYNGDGLQDLLGLAPEAVAPARFWLQRQDPRKDVKSGLLGAELRFEMPGLREAQPVRIPGRAGASVAVIERSSRRVVLSDLVEEPFAPGSGREIRPEVRGYPGGSSKGRVAAIGRIDGDRLADMVVTDADSNTMLLYRQSAGVGFGRPESFSAYKAPSAVAIGQWDGDGSPEVFVLSEEESVVGVSTFDASRGRLSFPAPLTLKTAGGTPVAMSFVDLDGVPTLAVVVKKRRDYVVELHAAPSSGGGVHEVELEDVNRSPSAMLGADIDQDGRTDLLLFTPKEPMVVVRSGDSDESGRPTEVLLSEDMAQFGLVEAAGPTNTLMYDTDGDGSSELLIADENFVRSCRYSTEGGWVVVEQVTVTEPGTALAGLTSVGAGASGSLIVADSGEGRLVTLTRDDGAWGVSESTRVQAFGLGEIVAGRFAGDLSEGVLCLSDSAFALARLGGNRVALEPFGVYRSESEDRLEHDIEVGDLNGDGYVDLVMLDAAEQMCSILTLSSSRKIHLATEFEVFQSRLFSRGAGREFEPRSAVVADATGDGFDDLILTVHDRLMIYPQRPRP